MDRKVVAGGLLACLVAGVIAIGVALRPSPEDTSSQSAADAEKVARIQAELRTRVSSNSDVSGLLADLRKRSNMELFRFVLDEMALHKEQQELLLSTFKEVQSDVFTRSAFSAALRRKDAHDELCRRIVLEQDYEVAALLVGDGKIPCGSDLSKSLDPANRAIFYSAITPDALRVSANGDSLVDICGPQPSSCMVPETTKSTMVELIQAKIASHQAALKPLTDEYILAGPTFVSGTVGDIELVSRMASTLYFTATIRADDGSLYLVKYLTMPLDQYAQLSRQSSDPETAAAAIRNFAIYLGQKVPSRNGQRYSGKLIPEEGSWPLPSDQEEALKQKYGGSIPAEIRPSLWSIGSELTEIEAEDRAKPKRDELTPKIQLEAAGIEAASLLMNFFSGGAGSHSGGLE